jgi:hypothetical protein
MYSFKMVNYKCKTIRMLASISRPGKKDKSGLAEIGQAV